MFRAIGLPELLVMLTVLGAIVPVWKIFSKAGYPGILAVTMFVPFLNIIMIFFLGFSEWPVLKELKTLRQRTPPSSVAPPLPAVR